MSNTKTSLPTAKITLLSLPFAASVFITGALWMMGEQKTLMASLAIFVALCNMLLYSKRSKDSIGTWVYLMLLGNIITALLFATDSRESENMQYLWLILALLLMLVLLGHYSQRRKRKNSEGTE